MKPGKIHALGDTLPRAPHASINMMKVLKINLEDVINGYEDDRFYGALLKGLKGEGISDDIMRKKVEKLLAFSILTEARYSTREGYVFLDNQFPPLCIPRICRNCRSLRVLQEARVLPLET